MSSGKYDLLANQISDFDAVRSPENHKSKKIKCGKWLIIAIVVLLLSIAVLTILTVVIVEATRNRPKPPPNTPTSSSIPTTPTPSPSPTPPVPGCPNEGDTPTVIVPCSEKRYDQDSCLDDGCCWYGNECILAGYSVTCSTNDNEMFDCLPENDNWNDTYAQNMCSRRGCCWNSASSKVYVKCYYPVEYGYKVTYKEADVGLTAALERNSPQPVMYADEVNQLHVEVIPVTNKMLRVKIYDPNKQRYEVPLNFTSTFTAKPLQKTDATLYSIDVFEDNFGFEVKRTQTDRTIFKTGPGLVFSDQFLQISAYLPSEYIYGLGEHATPWKLDTNYSKLTMFARDIPPDPVYDTNRNLYGVHPFYLCMEEDGSANGVFFVNSNAMEVELLPYPAISYRTIGGILDFYYFMGPSPEDVVSQYTELIGRPYMPPYWSLGFHLCRWGYLTANRTMEVVQSMRDHRIPQDTQWNDIDYMSNYLDFTYNHTSFQQLPQLVEDLHANGQHYVVITDPGISATQPKGQYPPFDDGLTKNIFITNSTGQPILGTVWPGITAYPDFTSPNITKYWSNEINKFHANVSFDGLWIDMNEPSNFVPGSTSVPPCPSSQLNTPPFLPKSIRQSWNTNKLIDKTLCMTAQQYYSKHYNVHSLYGHTEAITTMNVLESLYSKRSLVISRSTFPGSGSRCGHWLGDNASQWPHMRQSIPGILNFALFGIPLVGADICGFFDNTTEQLCTRWQQLGAFYPFSRNHNTYNANPQEPTQFSEYSINSTRDVLNIRYKLLPYLYTLFYHAHVNGSTVGRPLLSVFPTDKETWTNGRQFMWGDSLLISPVIEKDAVSVEAYFPLSRWYDYRTGAELTQLGNVTLDAPLDYIPLHVRGGAIIPQQYPSTTTTKSRENPYCILVALDDNEYAYGDMYIDDGEQLNAIENDHYSLVEMTAKDGQLTTALVNNGYTPTSFIISDVTIYGLSYCPQNITYNNQVLSADKWVWSNTTNVLSVDVTVSYSEVEFILDWE